MEPFFSVLVAPSQFKRCPPRGRNTRERSARWAGFGPADVSPKGHGHQPHRRDRPLPRPSSPRRPGRIRVGGGITPLALGAGITTRWSDGLFGVSRIMSFLPRPGLPLSRNPGPARASCSAKPVFSGRARPPGSKAPAKPSSKCQQARNEPSIRRVGPPARGVARMQAPVPDGPSMQEATPESAKYAAPVGKLPHP